jgi:hypothetical protein
VLGGLVLVVGAVVVAFWLTSDRAKPVTLRQAEIRLGRSAGTGVPGAGRPAPGVYQYTGSGTETLSAPPLSQPEGPSMPGTVTLQGAGCWVFRIDYSTHHWQTWGYCLHGSDAWEAGGQTWQLWSIGPIQVKNLSSFSCSPRTMALPAAAAPGERWAGRCTGTNTAVKGVTVSDGPYQFVGLVTMSVGGSQVKAAHFLRLRTDSGAQRGRERSDIWLDAGTGLPLRVRQDVKVTTATSFGTSTYTQVGVFTLASLAPQH